MYSPIQSLYLKGDEGNPLPDVWDSFKAKGIQFLRGQLVLICAGPGTGKSALILAYAMLARVPTLYMSADSGAFTQLTRMLSIITGCSQDEAKRLVRAGDLGSASAELQDFPIRFVYSATPTLDNIENAMMAYEEVYGDFPALVVIDNITNVEGVSEESDNQAQGLEALMDYFHSMGRETTACVVGLHHVTGQHNDGSKPIPLSGIKQQIGRVPEMVLTLHKIISEFGADSLRVSYVKNRNGRQDASGESWVELEFLGETMQIRDPYMSPTADDSGLGLDTEQEYDDHTEAAGSDEPDAPADPWGADQDQADLMEPPEDRPGDW